MVGWVGKWVSPLSRFHPRVDLAELVLIQTEIQVLESDKLLAFQLSGETKEALVLEADGIKKMFRTGSTLLGLFLSLVLFIQIVIMYLRSNWVEYHADKSTCYSCMRCVPYCPE